MARELSKDEFVTIQEMVMANTIQVDTMYQLLIQKGYFTEAEFSKRCGKSNRTIKEVGSTETQRTYQ